MRGNPRNQAGQIFRSIDRIGESRHAAKQTARAAGITGSHEISQSVGIYSFATMSQYRAICTDFLTWCRDAHGLIDAAKVSPELAAEWLSLKVASGAKRKTFSTYTAALGKMSAGLSSIYKRDFQYESALKPLRQEVKNFLPHKITSRAYARPEAMLQHLTDLHLLAAELQLFGGARVKEIAHLTTKNLAENNAIRLTNTKGGRRREITLPPDLFTRLRDIISQQGEFRIDYHQYLNQLRHAAYESEQTYTGTHGLRWNYAQRTFTEIQESGTGYEEALKTVSERLGHSRPEITLHYLR